MKGFESNRKILVIDDEITNLLSVEAALKSENFEIFTTTDPLDGLALFELERPAVLILDLRMPVMDGLEVLRKVKEVPDALFSVIILTGHGNKDDMNTCYDLGANAFLRKPLNVIELRGLVRNLMLLENYKRELNLHRDNLEGLVQSRTEDLRAEMEERRAAQVKLERSEKKYRNLFQTSTSGISIADLKGRILEMNRAFMNLIGIDKEQIPSFNIRKIYPDPMERDKLIQKLSSGELLENQETEIIAIDGRRIWCSISMKLIDYDGKKAVMANLMDNTEKHNARLKLRESELQHRMLADLVADYIYLLLKKDDGSFKTAWIRGNMRGITGYDLDNEQYASERWLKHVHPEDREIIQGFSNVLENRESVELEYRIMTSDGTIRWIRDRAKPYLAPDSDEIIGIIGGVTDITDFKQRISSLKMEIKKLKERI